MLEAQSKEPFLDDNARSALHFAMLGGALVLLLHLAGRLLRWVQALRHPDELADALRVFQRGYLLPEPHMVVGPDTDLAERLLLAALLALLLAIAAGLLVGLVMHATGRDGHAWGPRVGRVVLAICLAWCAYAALFLPTSAWHWEDGRVVHTERPSLVGRLAMPGMAQRSSSALLGAKADGDALVLLTSDGELRFVPEPGHGAERCADAARLIQQRYGPTDQARQP